MDRKFVMTGLGYGIIGLLMGIHMAATHNHGQLVTHAHIMLIGLVVSFIYGACYKLWLLQPKPMLAKLQFYSHQVGTLVVVICLYLMYGGHVSGETLEPFLATSSILVLLSMILVKVMFIQSKKQSL